MRQNQPMQEPFQYSLYFSEACCENIVGSVVHSHWQILYKMETKFLCS